MSGLQITMQFGVTLTADADWEIAPDRLREIMITAANEFVAEHPEWFVTEVM